MKSNYGIYIIESLEEDDDKDGALISEILNVCHIKNRYRFVASETELIHALEELNELNYRYVHMSFHGNIEGIALTNDYFISNNEFSLILEDFLVEKRLFLSACEGSNLNLAGKLITQNKVYSLVGSPDRIRFDKSLLFWPTFYHLMNEVDQYKMLKKDMKLNIKRLCNLFNIPINYYSFIRQDGKVWSTEKFREYKFIPGRKMFNKKWTVLNNG